MVIHRVRLPLSIKLSLIIYIEIDQILSYQQIIHKKRQPEKPFKCRFSFARFQAAYLSLHRHLNRRAAHGYHHHAIGFAQHFVVKINADDAVCAQRFGCFFHLFQRGFACAR